MRSPSAPLQAPPWVVSAISGSAVEGPQQSPGFSLGSWSDQRFGQIASMWWYVFVVYIYNEFICIYIYIWIHYIYIYRHRYTPYGSKCRLRKYLGLWFRWYVVPSQEEFQSMDLYIIYIYIYKYSNIECDIVCIYNIPLNRRLQLNGCSY